MFYEEVHSDVPVCWLTASITPIPKIKPPTVPSDLRPISVTPIFSRITERLVVRDYILPAITLESLCDQYAYKPSGSTTCALIDFTHRINTLLETNKYVRCIFVDLSKAFDTVCHYILAQKLIKLKMPPFIVGWIMAFLSNRTHATKLGFLLSNLAAFNMSVVQGSGIGPFLFIVYMLDLRALDILNYLLKYADDTTLINPESARVTAEEEMQHLFDWAKLNKMNINPNKTKEMVFHRPNPRSFVPPCEMADFRRVHSVKLFGVEFNSALDFNAHISAVVNCCNQRLYLLLQLKRLGLSTEKCDAIFKAIVISKFLYALPAFYGYLSQASKNKLSAILRKAKRWQLTQQDYSLELLASSQIERLFKKSLSSQHCLHHLYTPEQRGNCTVTLRRRGHNFSLPRLHYDSNRKGFIISCLYNYK